ncbi:MAG TPA: AmmeMemoRadiSam system protein B [Bacteroidia bacterium]|jgi:AmmeMemoRadiSam system protein B|nr:AmmeMemoRadiSam system protein B [Bacteroidia bacterium]
MSKAEQKISPRPLVDKIGFAHTFDQVGTFLARLEEQQGSLLEAKRAAHQITPSTRWKAAICPHDDYSYVGYLYPLVLQPVKSKVVVIIAVAHKAAMHNLSNAIIFDDFAHWHGIRKPIPVSNLREALQNKLPRSLWQVHRPMHQVEHSVESMLPILQYYNPDIEIVPILVPFMPFDKMLEISDALSSAIKDIATERKLDWGKDFSMLITTDAVHYGDEGWNGKNCNRFGVDKDGYMEAISYEDSIIDECLAGKINQEHLNTFYKHMVNDANYQEYKWTWCGRYAVPLGLLTTIKLAQKMNQPIPEGMLLAYSTSLSHEQIPVNDLDGMGITAPATLRHWVGYAALGYL